MADDPLTTGDTADTSELTALAGQVGERCSVLGLRIATVESCTGGLVGHLITEIPGSSAYYVGGFVTYSDELKREMKPGHRTCADIVVEILSPSTALYDRTTKSDTYRAIGVREMWLLDAEANGVPHDLLAAHGAVSAQVAMAMAGGGRARTAADLAVAVTGIAGPDGGSPAKPVGLTYIAVADAIGVAVRRHVWAGDRSENKRLSASAALALLLERIDAADSGIGPA